MALNSNGNTSSDRANSSAPSTSGVASPSVVPLGQAHRAGAQVVGRERVDDGQRVDERGVVSMAVGMAVAGVAVFGLSCVNSVNDDRPDAGAEHLAQVVVERSHGRWDLGHMSIM